MISVCRHQHQNEKDLSMFMPEVDGPLLETHSVQKTGEHLNEIDNKNMSAGLKNNVNSKCTTELHSGSRQRLSSQHSER
jgi:hypothetical protein